MNIKMIYACLSLLALSAMAPSAFADDDWYIGADLGRATYSGLEGNAGPFGFYFRTGSAPFIGSVTDHGTAIRLEAGYLVGPHFGVEVGYQDLGQASMKGSVTYPAVFPTATPVDNKVMTHGFLAEAVARWPFTEEWAIYAHAGPYLNVVDYEQGTPGSSTTDSAIKLTYGLGVSWTPSGLGVRVGWDRFPNLGKAYNPGEFSTSLVSVGLVYSF